MYIWLFIRSNNDQESIEDNSGNAVENETVKQFEDVLKEPYSIKQIQKIKQDFLIYVFSEENLNLLSLVAKRWKVYRIYRIYKGFYFCREFPGSREFSFHFPLSREMKKSGNLHSLVVSDSLRTNFGKASSTLNNF